MLANKIFLGRLFVSFVLLQTSILGIARAQDGLDDPMYAEDYERARKIATNSQPVKRADLLLVFMKERSNMHSKIRDYVNSLLLQDLEKLGKQSNHAALKDYCERALGMRPLFGEVYLYYGMALKGLQKMPEALNAFAKGSQLRSPLKTRAEQQLNALYRSSHKGSLVGKDKLIAEARKELQKLEAKKK